LFSPFITVSLLRSPSFPWFRLDSICVLVTAHFTLELLSCPPSSSFVPVFMFFTSPQIAALGHFVECLTAAVPSTPEG
jgi:hypothetical protein